MKSKNNRDSLGDRMKAYEDISRYNLVPRSYTLLRIDGRSFKNYTKNLKKPFDWDLIEDIDETAKYLCQNIQNAKFAYVQSDELSLLLTDFDTIETQPFFGGNIQKISSVVASMAAAKFNQLRYNRQTQIALEKDIDFCQSDRWSLACFDCRCWNVPTQIEVMNTFIWRNQDCMRNAISSLAQSMFSHKQLQGKSTLEMIDMIKNSINGGSGYKLDDKLYYGRLIVKKIVEEDNIYKTKRTKWISTPAWKFTDNNKKLLEMIPNNI